MEFICIESKANMVKAISDLNEPQCVLFTLFRYVSRI